ncbi:Na+/H+ antiporter subunit D [Blastococcus tunisiensis]|uniref:Multisubunit sodium/proton antiporter, MrpD subunit n=1 Tax=Blastococcus tunisiensis TaxID=1798228 RepID=A0A1I2DTT6_9ACTN|nr:Na+/H+ antiporter subunit D [Blastococcus sp. DSM 46838]SFE83936.1 multisubunit sodium/proton antiporter, MrpD subunit [Blastococcus sp. DSM 46838]
MMQTVLLLSVPVVLPLLAAGVSLLLSPFPIAQRVLGTAVLAAVLVDAAVLLSLVDSSGRQVLQAGGHPVPLGITLVADRFSALALVVAVVVCLAVLLYAIGQGSAERRIENVPSVFHPTYLVLVAGIALVLLTGDLFTLFVGFEVMLMASYVLTTLGPTVERVRAGMIYVSSSLTATILLLTTIGLVYAVTGTVNLAQLSELVPQLSPGLRDFLALLLLAVLGIKAAMVPLHWWLPDSYPAAPAPITAVFAALLTKVAVYAIVRTQTLLFPREEPWTLLLVLAAVTMLVGILGALAQHDLNRVLSFTLVSHIGFMLFGLAMSSVLGLTGTILYFVHHITVQAALFLVAGLVEQRRSTTELSRLGGLATAAPVLGALFLVPALSISGMPPLAGFLGKLALLQAAVADGTAQVLAVAGIALLTSLLTLAAMGRVWAAVFWGPPPAQRAPAGQEEDGAHEGDEAEPHRRTTTVRRAGRLRTVAAALAVSSGLAVAAGAGPLSAFAERAATDLADRAGYRTAVLDEGSNP